MSSSGKVALGCGIAAFVFTLAAVVGVIVLPVLMVRKVVSGLADMPQVNQTATGITVTNPSQDALTNVSITLQGPPHAKVNNAAKPGPTAYFYFKSPNIAPKQTVTIPFQSFHAQTGHPLLAHKFDINYVNISYDNGATFGSTI